MLFNTCLIFKHARNNRNKIKIILLYLYRVKLSIFIEENRYGMEYFFVFKENKFYT